MILFFLQRSTKVLFPNETLKVTSSMTDCDCWQSSGSAEVKTPRQSHGCNLTVNVRKHCENKWDGRTQTAALLSKQEVERQHFHEEEDALWRGVAVVFLPQVIRLEGQVTRYKSAAENAEKIEDELKVEKRKLQREVWVSLHVFKSVSDSI